MRVILILLLQVVMSVALGQAPSFAGFNLFAGKSVDLGSAICTDKNNYYYITGTFSNVSAFGADSLIVDCIGIPAPQSNVINGFLLRFDSTKTLDLKLTVSNGLLGKTVTDDQGNIIVSGAMNYGATRDGFLRKYDKRGAIVWTKFVQSFSASAGYGDDVITSLDISTDGSLVVSAFSNGTQVSVFGTPVAGPSNFVAKLSAQGDVQWIYHVTSTLGFGVYRVKFDDHGDVLIAGNEREITANESRGLIGKVSGITGLLLWKKGLLSTGSYFPWMRAIGKYKNGYIFGGEFGGQLQAGDSLFTSSGNTDIVIIKTDTAGNLLWANKGGSTGRDRLYSLICDTNSVTYITGGYSDAFRYNNFLNLPSRGYTDVYVIAVDSSGNALWEKHGGSTIPGKTDDSFYEEYGADITVDTKKQIHVIGTTRGSGNFGSLVFNAADDVMQNAFWLTLGKQEIADTVIYPCYKPVPVIDTASAFSVFVYPNPFLNKLVIDNIEKKQVTYQLLLTNTLGEVISNKTMNGSKILIEDWSSLAKGTYFLTISVAAFKKTFKLIKG